MTSQLFTLSTILGFGFLIAFLYPHREKIRGFILSLTVTCLARLQVFLEPKNNNSINKVESHFQSLAPTDDADENGKYSSALMWAIKHESIKNIAVTGPFGAGKTSVLKTFEKRNSDIEILNISLASFSEEISENHPNRYVWRAAKARDDEKRQREYLVEKSILQQIIYKETNKKLPMSRFERLSKVSNWSRWVKVIASVLLILLALLILKLDSETIVTIIKTFPELGLGYQLVIFIIVSGLIYSIALLLREFLKNKNVNKVSLLKGDIELSEKTGASILNLHIDEIIYFFEETDYGIVVFEDLDRFDGIEIFTKLREINTLLNQSKQLGNKKIVFIYAVRDDIFDEVSRTKFFDFIIPVIPIVNSSNSRDILLKKLRSSPYGTKISDKFVSDLTLYVDDMRLILNIFNEYIIYSEMLMRQIDLVPQKLLAFIVYKNKYPSDFSLLNKGKGVVAEALDNKNRIILDLSNQIDEKIENVQTHINNIKNKINNEIAKSSKELRSVYLSKYSENLPFLTYIQLDGKNIPFIEFLEESKFNSLIQDTGTVAIYQGSARHGRPSFQEIEKEVDPDYTYAERLELLEKNQNAILSKFYAEIEDLKEKKTNLRGRPLSFILEHFPDKKSDVLGKQVNDRLLSYLLTNSWIDEGYYNYLSYFHPGSRTPQDVNFLLAVNEKKQLPFTYKIDSPEEVLKQLTSHDLESRYAMNLDLLDYMYTVCSPRLPEFLSNCEKFSKDDFDFVIAFVSYSKYSDKFVGDLSGKWYVFLFEVLINLKVTEPNKIALLKLVFQNSSPGTILNQNKDSVITKFISSSEEGTKFLLHVSIEKSIEVLKKINIIFNKINLLNSSHELFEFVVDSNYYSINPDNLKCIFDYYELEYRASYPNFSDIQSVSNPDIYAYVTKNLNTYVKNVLLSSRSEIEENETSIKTLLNSAEVNIDNKRKIVQKVIFSLEEIGDVVSEIEILWPQLLKYRKIKVTWHNVFEASFHGEKEPILDELWQYLADEEVSQLLSEQNIPALYHADAPDFFKKLIQVESIGPDVLKKLIKLFSIQIESLGDYDLRSDITHVLVNAGKVTLTDENILILREQSISHVEELLVKNIAEFSDEASHIYQVSSAELDRLLNNSSLTRERKLQIISKYQDLFLGKSQLQDSAWNVIKDGYPFISLDDELVLQLTNRLNNMSDKCLFLSTQVGQRSWVSLSNLLSNTGIKPLQQIASRRRFIKMNNTIGAAKLVDTLFAKGHISSYGYEEDGDGDEKLKINSKRK